MHHNVSESVKGLSPPNNLAVRNLNVEIYDFAARLQVLESRAAVNKQLLKAVAKKNQYLESHPIMAPIAAGALIEPVASAAGAVVDVATFDTAADAVSLTDPLDSTMADAHPLLGPMVLSSSMARQDAAAGTLVDAAAGAAGAASHIAIRPAGAALVRSSKNTRQCICGKTNHQGSDESNCITLLVMKQKRADILQSMNLQDTFKSRVFLHQSHQETLEKETRRGRSFLTANMAQSPPTNVVVNRTRNCICNGAEHRGICHKYFLRLPRKDAKRIPFLKSLNLHTTVEIFPNKVYYFVHRDHLMQKS